MNKANLLIASQQPEWTDKIVNAMQETAEEMPAFAQYCKVTIRPHPTLEIKEKYKSLLNGKMQVEIDRKTDLSKQMYNARALLTVHSTIALEALIMQKLVVICGFAAPGERNMYRGTKANGFPPMLFAETKQQFKQAMKEMHW